MQDSHHLTFDIPVQSTPSDSFRVNSVRSSYDLKERVIRERFTGDLALPEKWNIGLIVGSSGSGKTTIARQLFGEPKPIAHASLSVIDDMPDSPVDEIERAFTNVGFSSIPSWLKPYHVLSNGERMRVDLAAALLSQNNPIIFDEFTSVVDRAIAENLSIMTAKTIRKTNRQFIAVSWLQPDWVYDTDRRKIFRPKLVSLHRDDSRSDGAGEKLGEVLADTTI